MGLDLDEDAQQRLDIRRGEHRVWPLRSDISERRLVKPSRLQDSALGETGDHEVDEVQLVSAQRPAGEEVLEGCGCRLPVETDKGTDEQPEAAGLLRRTVEVLLVGDPRLQQEALELADVSAG